MNRDDGKERSGRGNRLHKNEYLSETD